MLKKYEIKYIIPYLKKWPFQLAPDTMILMAKRGESYAVVYGTETRQAQFPEDGLHIICKGNAVRLSGANPVEALYQYYRSLDEDEQKQFEEVYYVLCEDIDAIEREEEDSSDAPLRILGDSRFTVAAAYRPRF